MNTHSLHPLNISQSRKKLISYIVWHQNSLSSDEILPFNIVEYLPHDFFSLKSLFYREMFLSTHIFPALKKLWSLNIAILLNIYVQYFTAVQRLRVVEQVRGLAQVLVVEHRNADEHLIVVLLHRVVEQVCGLVLVLVVEHFHNANQVSVIFRLRLSKKCIPNRS